MAENIKGINIEIGGNTTGFTKALGNVKREVNSTQKELKEVNKALQLDPKSTEFVAQKQKLLSDQVNTTKTKLEALKKAKAQADKDMANGTEINEKQYRELQREIVTTENQLKSYESQLKSVNANSSKFAFSMQDIGKKLGDIGSKMTNTGTKMTKGITTPIIAFGGASLKAFDEVDSALDTVATKTGATGKNLENMNESVKRIATDIPSDFEEVGNAVGEVNTQFGFMDSKLEKSTEQIIKFAQINGQDVTSSTISAKGAIEAYSLQAKDLDSVLDAVTKSSQNTGVGTDKIFDSVTKGAPQLKALGLNFAQSAEMMGRFEQKGLDGSKALSYMAKAQVTFAKEGKTLGQGMSELTSKIKNSSSETEQLTYASEYFGTKGASVMLDAIKRGAFDFEDFEDASKNASGAVTNTFNNTLDPIDRFKQTLNSAKGMLAEFAEPLQETLEPALKDVGEHLKKLSEKFKKLSPEQKKLITKIGLTAAALGPLLVGGGKVAKGISGIIELGGKLNPKIGGFIGKTGPKLTGFFGKTGTSIMGLGKKGGGLIAKAGPKLGTFFGGIGTKVMSVAKLFGVKGLVIGLAIGAVVTAGVLLYKNWDKIKAKAHELHMKLAENWKAIKLKTELRWHETKEAITKPFIEAKDKVVNKVQELKNQMSEKWESIKNTTREKFNNIKSSMTQPFTDAKNKIHEKIDSIKNKFNNLKLKEIKIPHMKLPHFSLTGHFSLKDMTVPKLNVDWHAKGGIFTNPTLIPSLNGGLHGVGEAGPEAILPLSILNGIVENAMRRVQNTYNSTTKTTVINQYAPPQQANTFQIGADKVGNVITPTVTYATAMNRKVLKGALGV